MDIQAATIGEQRWEAEASKIFCLKIVKKVGDFLWETAQLAELAKQHLVGADHLHHNAAKAVVTCIFSQRFLST